MQNERLPLPVLIAQIARSATPVTPLRPPLLRLAGWEVASTLAATATIFMIGARGDLASQLLRPWFVARAAATLALMHGAGSVAFLMTVPGLEPSLRRRILSLSGGIGWAVLLLWAAATAISPAGSLAMTPHPRCVIVMITIALPSALLLLHLLRDGMPLQPRATASFAAVASLALGAIGSQFVCGVDAASHHLLWHFIPLALLACGASPIGAFMLRRPY